MIKLAVDSFLLVNNSSFKESLDTLYGSLSYVNYRFRENNRFIDKESLVMLVDSVVVFFANNSLVNYNDYNFEKIEDHKNKLLSNAIIKVATICDFDVSLADIKKYSKEIVDYIFSFVSSYNDLNEFLKVIAIKYVCEYIYNRHKIEINAEDVINEFKDKEYSSVTNLHKEIEFYVLNKNNPR